MKKKLLFLLLLMTSFVGTTDIWSMQKEEEINKLLSQVKLDENLCGDTRFVKAEIDSRIMEFEKKALEALKKEMEEQWEALDEEAYDATVDRLTEEYFKKYELKREKKLKKRAEREEKRNSAARCNQLKNCTYRFGPRVFVLFCCVIFVVFIIISGHHLLSLNSLQGYEKDIVSSVNDLAKEELFLSREMVEKWMESFHANANSTMIELLKNLGRGKDIKKFEGLVCDKEASEAILQFFNETMTPDLKLFPATVSTYDHIDPIVYEQVYQGYSNYRKSLVISVQNILNVLFNSLFNEQQKLVDFLIRFLDHIEVQAIYRKIFSDEARATILEGIKYFISTVSDIAIVDKLKNLMFKLEAI